MLSNYLKSAFRNLVKQRFYTLVNILGLAIGIASCLVILLFVLDEINYDKHHKKADRIYRVIADIKFFEDALEGPVLPAPLAKTLVADYPEVINAGRFRGAGNWLIKRKDSDFANIREEDVIYADQEIFEIFDFEVIEGDLENALTEPNTMVITRRMAKKYFENESALGKTLTLNNRTDVKVTAVVEDLPQNSHFQFDFYRTLTGNEEAESTFWVSHNFATYFELAEGANVKDLEAKFPAMLERYAGPQVKQFLNMSMAEFEENGNRISYFTQPLLGIHLHSDFSFDFPGNGDIKYVYIFTAIAIFILLLACINFMNLSTARSANRAKEVGIRKVLGSQKSALISQFLVESTIVSFVAFLLAILFAELLIPVFNQMSGKELVIPYASSWFFPLFLTAALIIGILAGIYPAFFLSNFKPVSVLKGKASSGASGSTLRSILVVFQFTASIALIIGTIIVFQQMRFIQQKNLGFDKDQVILVEDTWVIGEQVRTFKEAVLNNPEFLSGTISGYYPVSGTNRNNTVFWPEGKLDKDHQILMQNWRVDQDYVKTLGLEIIEGRGFSKDFATDSQAMILNETAVRNFGFEDPIGQRIATFSNISNEDTASYDTRTVIGVVKDFHFESLKENISGLCLFMDYNPSMMAFKIKSQDAGIALDILKEKWSEFAPTQPFDYSFLDERFASMYDSTVRIQNIFGSFAILAILVACLGLFALASFLAEKRTKEIGIRKVLGANVKDIIFLLSKHFALLVSIAWVIASIIGWFSMNAWLDEFQYRVDLNFGIFILAGIIAMLIALVTVSSQSIKAATINPAISLKDE